MDKIFCNNIKDYRKNKNWSTKEVSEKLEIDEIEYEKLETGFQEPTFEICKKLSNLYNIEVSDLSLEKKNKTSSMIFKNFVEAPISKQIFLILCCVGLITALVQLIMFFVPNKGLLGSTVDIFFCNFNYSINVGTFILICGISSQILLLIYSLFTTIGRRISGSYLIYIVNIIFTMAACAFSIVLHVYFQPFNYFVFDIIFSFINMAIAITILIFKICLKQALNTEMSKEELKISYIVSMIFQSIGNIFMVILITISTKSFFSTLFFIVILFGFMINVFIYNYRIKSGDKILLDTRPNYGAKMVIGDAIFLIVYIFFISYLITQKAEVVDKTFILPDVMYFISAFLLTSNIYVSNVYWMGLYKIYENYAINNKIDKPDIKCEEVLKNGETEIKNEQTQNTTAVENSKDNNLDASNINTENSIAKEVISSDVNSVNCEKKSIDNN